MASNTFYFFSGEASGDLHGAHLLAALKERLPNDRVFKGVGGPQMRAQGLTALIPMEEFQVMGLTAVLAKLPTLWKHFYAIRNAILEDQPVATILIDYPGFNLRLAQALRKKGYKGKLIHYISPSVWAWGQQRIAQMEATLDRLLTIYPFEKACFEKSSLSVKYVGNPLVDYINIYKYQPLPLPLGNDLPLVALFPGSRRSELEKNLATMLSACRLLRKTNPMLSFAVSASDQANREVILSILHCKAPDMIAAFHLVPRNFTYELMARCSCALATSGTVTLELALHHKPTVVVYQMGRLNKWWAKNILHVNLPYYCIVNILAGREIFPEFIVRPPDAQAIASLLNSFLTDTAVQNRCISDCQHIAKNLCAGEGGASVLGAKAIVELL